MSGMKAKVRFDIGHGDERVIVDTSVLHESKIAKWEKGDMVYLHEMSLVAIEGTNPLKMAWRQTGTIYGVIEEIIPD
jgi:hypothetical protein